LFNGYGEDRAVAFYPGIAFLKRYLFALLILLILSAFRPCSSQAAGAVDYEALQDGIVEEVNAVRADPDSYSAFLKEMRRHYRGKHLRRPGESPLLTKEGVKAVDEAIRFLDEQNPVSRLKESKGLTRAAGDLVEAQGPLGETGHRGPDGSQPADRIGRHGKWESIIGENIAYGRYRTGRDVVAGLIVDDGVPDRGHRKTLFHPSFRLIGVNCGPHKVYRTMCVMNFAGGLREK